MKRLFLLGLGGIIYYLTAIFGMSIFSFYPSNITVLWLPFGIAVVFIHYFGLVALPFVFFGSFFANFHGMDNGNLSATVLHTAISAFADTLAPLVSVWLLKRFVDDKIDSIKGFLPFTLYGIILPTFISSIIISMNLYYGNYIESSYIIYFTMLLMFSDGLGLYLLYPLYKNLSKTIPSREELKYAIISGLIITLIIHLSMHYYFLVFLIIPFILILVFKLRTDLVSLVLLIVVIELIRVSTANSSPFGAGDEIDSILMLMSFVSSLVFLVIGISQHQKDLLRLQVSSRIDALTQAKNRLSYKETIDEFILNYRQNDTPFSILLFDIDDFKHINDTYGHRVGDIVLSDLSSLIQKNIRDSDFLFRVGGEEFVLLFSNTRLDNSIVIGEKLRKLIENGLNTLPDKKISVSMGITQIMDNDSEDSLYRRVDELLYKSKNSGKNKLTADI